VHPSEDGRDTYIGTVRVTSVPILTNRLLASSARDLIENHPGLIIELIPDSRDFSLTRREADISIRLARPMTGGTNIKARRIATLEYAAFAPTTIHSREIRRLPWITYEDAMSHLPQRK